MGNITYFPDLGPQGWTDSTTIILDKMMAHFFISEYSQTSIFPGLITSFPYLLQKFKEDPPGLAVATREALIKYFNRAFNNVAVDCSIVDSNVDNSLSMSLYVEFYDAKGIKYVAARMAETYEGKFIKLVNINNGDLK